MDKKKTLNELLTLINWLECHNKNYTKDQYYRILDIQEIIENIINGGFENEWFI